MTSRFIGLKELRQNISKVAREALKKNQRLIVLKKNVPIFELRPLTKKEASLEELLLSVKKAESDVKAGRVFTQKDVEQRYGL